MIIVMRANADAREIQKVSEKIAELGFKPHVIKGIERTVIGAIGDNRFKERLKTLVSIKGVDNVYPITKPYKLAARSTKHEDTIVDVDGVKVGGDNFVVMAGPCSVENKDQMQETAKAIKASGASMIRGGAYKPRTSPYSFQGLEEEGLKLLKEAKKNSGLPIVTELLSVNAAKLIETYTDLIQIGARNMQNFSLLRDAGKLNRPILLKRGLSATLEEWLMSAEYILAEGNYNVILCERGIRTFETAYRNTLDLNAVPKMKQKTHLPIIVDPSHGTGDIALIPAMAKAAIAAGADGLMIEVHPEPEKAFSDGPQSLTLPQFDQLMKELKPYIKLAGKKLVTIK